MRFNSVGLLMLGAASMLLNACGGGGSDGGVSSSPSPIYSAGTTSSRAGFLTPIAPVEAVGGAQFSNTTVSTKFPAVSAYLSGSIGPNAILSSPAVFDTDGSDMQITFNPGNSFLVERSDGGGTIYADTYGAGTFILDSWFVFKELPTGDANAVSDFIYYLPAFASDVLDYTQFGVWSRDTTSGGANTIFAPYAIGFFTPLASVPGSGSASYSGRTIGVGALSGTDGGYLITGGFAANANFSAGTIAVSFTQVTGTNGLTGVTSAFSNFGGTLAITGNGFTGGINSTATSGPVLTNTGSLTGAVEGRFFGPNAVEAGGVWQLTGGGWSAAGAFAGSQ